MPYGVPVRERSTRVRPVAGDPLHSGSQMDAGDVFPSVGPLSHLARGRLAQPDRRCRNREDCGKCGDALLAMPSGVRRMQGRP